MQKHLDAIRHRRYLLLYRSRWWKMPTHTWRPPWSERDASMRCEAAEAAGAFESAEAACGSDPPQSS
eukprot:scaffold3_cov273-Pinguiococcus_pyrenoidosus.AAC.10